MVRVLSLWALFSSLVAIALAAPAPAERDSPLIDNPVDVPAPIITIPYCACGECDGDPIGCPEEEEEEDHIDAAALAPHPEPVTPLCGPYSGLPMCFDTAPEPTIDVPAPPSSDSRQLTPRARNPIKYSECVSDAMIALHNWRRSCLETYPDILSAPWCRLTAPSPKSCCIDHEMAFTCLMFRPADNPEWRAKTCDKGSELYEPEWCNFIDPIEKTCVEDSEKCLDKKI